MVNLNAEMAELWASLGAPAAGRARTIQIVSARRGEGASTVARELAFFAARRAGRSVWLVDLDLMASPQHAAVTAESERYGVIGEPAAASPDGSIFFSIQPPARGPDGAPWPDARYLSAHRVGAARWWVTRFRREALRGRQGVHVLADGDYWSALRRHADLIIVDCPSADRSQAAMTVAPFMDQTLLVVAADEADVRAPALLRDALVGAGADVVGLFFNRVTVEQPPFARAFLR
ncbi:MAG: sugar kinase [Phenylobacterium sp.]|uniref:sugar kinase n=1 Tax=Phenylobacterium sp. TaxID=1871053 RepID=UPI0025E97C36|nr:sugar kinase [Phenylobacterium sp.]MCG9916900.1 sugar kinase [Phenylobacterium sp.]